MATYKFLGFLAFITIAGAVEYQHQYDLPPAKYPESEAPAHYDLSYDAHDKHTGDVTEQKKSRGSDVVHGSYRLTDADGNYKGIIEYTAEIVQIVHYAKDPARRYYESDRPADHDTDVHVSYNAPDNKYHY